MFTGTCNRPAMEQPTLVWGPGLDCMVQSLVGATKRWLGIESLLRIVHLFPVSPRDQQLIQTRKSNCVQHNPLKATLQREDDSSWENRYNLPVLPPTTCFLGKATFGASVNLHPLQTLSWTFLFYVHCKWCNLLTLLWGNIQAYTHRPWKQQQQQKSVTQRGV